MFSHSLRVLPDGYPFLHVSYVDHELADRQLQDPIQRLMAFSRLVGLAAEALLCWWQNMQQGCSASFLRAQGASVGHFVNAWASGVSQKASSCREVSNLGSLHDN